MENYICINGKKAELTEEQLKALGIELPKPSPFERVCNNANDFYEYYFINSYGVVTSAVDRGYSIYSAVDDWRYNAANYCTDKTILEQRALHETLNRLLWRYSMEHDGDKINWSDIKQRKYFIYYSRECSEYRCEFNGWKQTFSTVYFYNSDIAEAAIKKVVEPFMVTHPEFKW